MFEIVVEDYFAAAHFLRGYRGQCENLHGHNYRVQVVLRGQELSTTGLLMDFSEAKALLKKTLATFDHSNLSDLPVFQTKNPSAENIAQAIYQDLHPAFNTSQVTIAKVTVWETERNSASYLPECS